MTVAASASSSTQSSPTIISEEAFAELIGRRFQPLLALAMHLERCSMGERILTRPLLGRLLSEAAQMEELFDAFRARNNLSWYMLRDLVACAKLFSDSCYKLLHMHHSHPGYYLLPVGKSLEDGIHEALLFNSFVIMQVAARIVSEARKRGLPSPPRIPGTEEFLETLPPGALPNNRMRRHVRSAEETVARLATAFLNLAAESEILHCARKRKPTEYESCIPDPINESELRQLENKFHNLQSLYDTYVSDTDTENLDRDLPVLRGHISILFHLLEIATLYTHYFERHMVASSRDTLVFHQPIVSSRALLATLFEFCIDFASRYLESARSLCHRMLKRYAEIGRIRVPVPIYRGFHVRPSTLIAKICHHYGSEVSMEMEGEIYDASAPLDLFRANERINAEKRRRLAEEIARMDIAQTVLPPTEMVKAVHEIILNLAAENKIVIYDQQLPLEELRPHPEDTLAQFAKDVIARLLALGKIDIPSSLTVIFVGDKRVLKDIETLAQCGYGEDRYGNNIPLPKALSYLRR